MTESDNSWNLIKLQEDQKVSSKSLTIDVLSEESHGDDDILSNTSSCDEPGEFSFRSANEDCQLGVESVSDSLTTLTGLKGIGEKKDNSWKIKTWHIIILTSLVSVSLSLGVQKFWNLWMVPDIPKDVTILSRNGVSSNEVAALYSHLNFWEIPMQGQSKDQSVTTTQSSAQWKPSGKFYVDFDNRIAYPMPDEEVIGWQRFKTDFMIFWYTSKSKVKSLFPNETIKSLQNSYHGLLVLVTNEAAKIRCKVSVITEKVLESTISVWKLGESRTIKSLNFFHQWALSKKSNFILKLKQFGPKFDRTTKGFRNYNHKLHKKAWMWHRGTRKAVNSLSRRR